MRLSAFSWGVAIAISVAAHFSAASVIGEPSNQILIEGSAGDFAVVLLGDAAVDAVAAGAVSDTLDAQDVTETLQEHLEEVQISEEVKKPQLAEEVDVQEPTSQPLEEPVEAATQEIVAQEEVAAETVNEIKAVEEVQDTVAMPVPATRPETRKTPPKETKKKPIKTETKKAPTNTTVKKKSGSGGTSNTNTKKQAAKGNASPKISQAGNAAISNYPGKIARRLSRSLRYPKSALRGSRTGQAKVAFVVTKNGQVRSTRIIASSGNPALDKAALDAVHRAAPFPPIPAGTGRDQWHFTVPIYFKR